MYADFYRAPNHSAPIGETRTHRLKKFDCIISFVEFIGGSGGSGFREVGFDENER
jgi:hypothetical protein